MKVRHRDPPAFLRRAIRFAKRLEKTIPEKRLANHKVFLGFGFLVRNRRLAEGVLTLGTAHAYEARLLIRSMLEIQINYSWIQKGKGHSRALRFIRFEPIERLQITTDIQDIFDPAKAAELLQRFRTERSTLRHLFRMKSKKGKAVWAMHWATVPSLRDRFLEVYKAEGGKDKYPFTYGLYRLQSSAVHGGPLSLGETIYVGKRGHTRPKHQPERDPTAHMKAAATTLLATATRVAADARVVRKLQPEIGRLAKLVKPRV